MKLGRGSSYSPKQAKPGHLDQAAASELAYIWRDALLKHIEALSAQPALAEVEEAPSRYVFPAVMSGEPQLPR